MRLQTCTQHIHILHLRNKTVIVWVYYESIIIILQQQELKKQVLKLMKLKTSRAMD